MDGISSSLGVDRRQKPPGDIGCCGTRAGDVAQLLE